MIKLNARGTVIECSKSTIDKSKVLCAYYDKWNYHNEPFFLDYDVKVVHTLLDYLNGSRINNLDKIRHIADKLMIELEEGVIILTGEKIATIQQDMTAKYNEFVTIMKTKYDVTIDTYNSSVLLSMMSYYCGFHLREITDLICEYDHFCKVPVVLPSMNDVSKYCDIIERMEKSDDYIVDIGKSIAYTLTGEYYVFEKNLNYFEVYHMSDLFRIIVTLNISKDKETGRVTVVNKSMSSIEISDTDDAVNFAENITTIVKKSGKVNNNNYKVIHGELKYRTSEQGISSLFKCPFILSYNRFAKM